jgi:hypothetical protein
LISRSVGWPLMECRMEKTPSPRSWVVFHWDGGVLRSVWCSCVGRESDTFSEAVR